MISKEKALELVNKFRNYTDGTDEDDRFSPVIEKENAKQCALIAVEEVLNNIEVPSDEYKYWTEVKQEIEKL